MNVYQEIIRLATGVTAPADLEEIEDYMRNVYWNSTLSWQTREMLEQSARESWIEIQFMRDQPSIESCFDDAAYNQMLAILAGVDLNLGEQQ